MKIIISINTSWNFINFRSGLIKALVASGHEVVAVAPKDACSARLPLLGCRYVPLPMDNKGTNPVKDMLLLWRYHTLFRREKPGVYLGYTVKPNIYGSIAAHLNKIPVINNIAGLGAVFISDGWLTGLVKKLYTLALFRSNKVFFQNNDDLLLFVDGGLVSPEKAERIPGSGIDLERFNPSPLDKKKGDPITFLLIARLLWDKGVGEFVEAARLLRGAYPDTQFHLLGFLNVENPSAISKDQVDAWEQQGYIKYLGVCDDVRNEITRSDCVVLPSYREGLPRTLLEAAAMGRPVIATDVAGCRDVVDDGWNGYLCNPKDAHDLARKMEQMIRLSQNQRDEMGVRGRRKVALEFDENIVIERYIGAIENISKESSGSCVYTTV